MAQGTQFQPSFFQTFDGNGNRRQSKKLGTFTSKIGRSFGRIVFWKSLEKVGKIEIGGHKLSIKISILKRTLLSRQVGGYALVAFYHVDSIKIVATNAGTRSQESFFCGTVPCKTLRGAGRIEIDRARVVSRTKSMRDL